MRWEASGWRFGLSGRGKADSGGYCRRRVRAVCLVVRCPCGEAVGEDVSASVAFVVCGGAEGDVLVGVEQVGCDADRWTANRQSKTLNLGVLVMPDGSYRTGREMNSTLRRR